MVQKEQWQLAGSAPDVYERYLVPAIFGVWAPVLIDAAALRPGDRVLDLACGTGVVARQAKPHVGPTGAVTGVDLNPGMLAIARSVEPSIDWQEGNAGALPFTDGSFDVVFCQLGMQYFPDRSAAIGEMHRVPVGRHGRIAEGRDGSGKVRSHESVSSQVGATGGCIPGGVAVERQGGCSDSHACPHPAQGG
jgi:ubiquinone/menaquinone biosynthesis C-methylase UbiE